MENIRKAIRNILFENELAEIGPAVAARAYAGGYRGDDRTKKIKRDVPISLFNDMVGKNLNFYIKTASSNSPAKYQLVDVEFDMYGSTNGRDGNSPTMALHFYNENGGSDGDSPFSDQKKEVVMIYSLKQDDYIGESNHYLFNALMVNALIKAAGRFRALYYTINPINNQQQAENRIREIDWEATEQAKRTRLTKASFKMFDYDSRNMFTSHKTMGSV